MRMGEFFSDLTLPSISSEQAKILNAPITLNEIMAVIAELKGSKAPGPDRFIPEFYKAFKFCLAPRLFRVFASAFELKKVPVSWQEVSVVLIPK